MQLVLHKSLCTAESLKTKQANILIINVREVDRGRWIEGGGKRGRDRGGEQWEVDQEG